MIAFDAIAPASTLPFLVSFPRTGSHWLRSFLELYFDRPLLSRSFYEHDNQDFLLYHTHDLRAETDPDRNVLYLYRSVVSTVFSQLTYEQGDRAADLPSRDILAVAEQYREHLHRWLVPDGPARGPRCVLTYESLLDHPVPALARAIEFLGGTSDEARIAEIWPTVTHESVRQRTTHDPRVISADSSTHLRRELFRYRWGRAVIALFERDERLARVMDPGTIG